MVCRLVDAKAYAGDDAADGNLARTALALDAASAPGLAAALERAVGAELERIGMLIIDCGSGADFLARARLR